jgi:ATP-dependent RNA helicase DDX23/PRP28
MDDESLGKKEKEYLKKKREEMTERDWRIFREDKDILIKGGKVPEPIRHWEDIKI